MNFDKMLKLKNNHFLSIRKKLTILSLIKNPKLDYNFK
jgi:hypothetical protein